MSERVQRRVTRATEVDDAPLSQPQSRPQAGASDLDALLDEIDEVLEVDAESYVRGFVQKGGQ